MNKSRRLNLYRTFSTTFHHRSKCLFDVTLGRGVGLNSFSLIPSAAAVLAVCCKSAGRSNGLVVYSRGSAAPGRHRGLCIRQRPEIIQIRSTNPSNVLKVTFSILFAAGCRPKNGHQCKNGVPPFSTSYVFAIDPKGGWLSTIRA